MGRHADSSRKRGFHVPIGIISIVIVLLCAVGLGIWWWSLKSATDPIDANPVDAYGVVVSSPACPAGGTTVVTVSGTKPPVTAALNACGYRVGEQLPIQYLAGHPETVRLAGTSTAGTHSMAARLLPIGILAAGLIAVLATIALLIERRRSRHQVATTTRRAGRAPTPPAAGAPPGSAALSAARMVPQVADGAEGGAVAAAPMDSQAGVFSEDGYGTAYQGASYQEVGYPDAAYQSAGDRGGAYPNAVDGDVAYPASDPSAAYPDADSVASDPQAAYALESSVVTNEGELFTHANPEPTEPAGAPVELTGDEPERG